MESHVNEYTRRQVALHNNSLDCWVIVGKEGAKKIYDITPFLQDHPGGPELVLHLAGHDATIEFDDVGHDESARRLLETFCIGNLREDETDQLAAQQERQHVPPADSYNGIGVLLSIFVLIGATFYSQINQGKLAQHLL
ncbi:hypothetical protein AC1031_010216 [Aphanomyces cochlioides]|nr:hypothetical protein AC1031_010216 [Aphanomyces cochlioides]